MTANEFKALALDHLDQCDETDREEWATEQPDADWVADAHSRWIHARKAFPGMDWEEFCDLDTKRKRQGTKQRPEMSVSARAAEPGWQAVRDADRIKNLWARLYPNRPRPSPPLHPHDIAAERHGVPRQLVEDRIKKSNKRRIDKIAAQK